MVEKELIKEAAQVTAEEGVKEAAKLTADLAVKEATSFGWKEGVFTGFAIAGGVATGAAILYGALKLGKFIAKKVKAKKPIPVAEEVPEQTVNVEKAEQTVEAKVE